MNRKSITRRGQEESETGGGGSTRNTTQKKRRSSAPQVLASPLTGILLRPLLVECLSYLYEESIRRVCFVSKHYHALIHTYPKLKDKYLSSKFGQFMTTMAGDRSQI